MPRWLWLQRVALAVVLPTACGGQRPIDDRQARGDRTAIEAPADADASVVPPAEEPDAGAPVGQRVKFHAGMFSQCAGTTAEDEACRGKGEQCMYLAMVPHPCSNSGVRCTPERERAVHNNFPPCVCSCSKQWRDWQRAEDARYRNAPPRP